MGSNSHEPADGAGDPPSPTPERAAADIESGDASAKAAGDNYNSATATPRSPAAAFQTRDSEALTLSWHNLTFQVDTTEGCFKAGEPKRIVKGASGRLNPGTLTAIMGPSGAGKTTLLNVLAGRAPYGTIAEGNVYLNGKDADPTLYRTHLAYVMQADALFATQTPREALHFTAAMRLPDYTEAQRGELVESALSSLGLGGCADTLIGSAMLPGLSGGEKKRTAVAVELISSPSLIFLDEPTSGLDSHSAFELVKILRSLAEAGCTIVCTIHQPSSEVFALFHNVVMLKGGRVAYRGAVVGVGEHFETASERCPLHSNPADFAMHRLQMMTDDDAQVYVTKVPELAPTEVRGVLSEGDLKPLVTAGFFVQLGHLISREFFNLVRDKASLGARFGVAVVLAVLLGLIFFGVGSEWGRDGDPDSISNAVSNHWGAVVFSSINAMFLAAQPMLLAFPIERAAFIREYTAGSYGTAAYLIGKTCIDVPAAFLQILLGTVIFYFLVDLQANFAYLVFSQASLAVVSASLALLVGASTTRAETAVQLVPVIYVPQILFAGFFVSLDQVPVYLRWLQWICPLKYGVALATTAEFASSVVPDNREKTVAQLVERNNINRDDWWVLAIVTLGLFLGFRILGAVLLSRRAQTFE